MKRHFFAALLLFILAGCAIDESYQSARLEEQQITIKAIKEDDALETRTMRDEEGKVYWCKGDQISLFYGSGTNGGSVFTSTQEEDLVKVTNFVGTITAITGGGEISVNDTYFWGLYPYNENATCDGTSITTTLSSHQVAYPGSYANGTNISVGRSQGLIMGFYNACGGFRFSLNKEGVKKVTFKGNNGENLAGKLKISFVNGKIKTEILEGENEVVLEAPAGKYFEPGVLYYIVLAPAELKNGFTVKAETFTEETTFTYSSSVTIEATNFKSKKLMDTGLTWTQKTGNIPIEDANFKAYLVENYDGNGDGEISFEEAKQITDITINSSSSIWSVQGIEYMDRLSHLTVSNTRLTELDITNNTELKLLNCRNNQLTTLDVSNNLALEELICNLNQLVSLDVSCNVALVSFNCSSNELPSLDVSNNSELKQLLCADNQLTYLNVASNTKLEKLSINSNRISSLDISNNTALIELECQINELTTLDVSNNTALNHLWCHNNELRNLNLSKNTALKTLDCHHNEIIILDVSKNTALTSLDCSSNQLAILKSNNTPLKYLNCSSNRLTSLNVSITTLTNLNCSNNELSSLDVSNCSALGDLNCNFNRLSSIDVSNNARLYYLECTGNLLTSLDISNNASLKQLLCDYNLLTTLDVSHNLDLSLFVCSPMKDSNGSNLLETLYISQNQEIPNITTNRNDNYIPAETQIVVKPDDGGTDDNTNDEL